MEKGPPGASLVAQMVKKSACNAGDLGSIPRLGRSPEKGNGYSLEYSCLGTPRIEKPGRQCMGSKELSTTEQLGERERRRERRGL